MSPTGAPATAPATLGRTTGRAAAAGPLPAPGVAVEWVGPVFRELEALRSDVAGFVGLATRGPIDNAKRLVSAAEFDGLYGPPQPGMHLSAAVQGFFANGGATCWVVRAVDRTEAACARASLGDDTGITFVASSEGTWADGLVVEVRPVDEGLVTVTLTPTSGRPEVWSRLDLLGVEQRFGRHLTTFGGAVSRLVTVELDVERDATLPAVVTRVKLAGGHDGLSGLTPAHLTGDERTVVDGKVHGAALLADIDEVAQVCVPDLVVREQGGERDVPAYTVDAVRDATAQLVGDCHAAGRTALLQHPDPRALCDEAVRWSEGLDSSNAAVYWPWLRTADTSRPGSTVAVPPCGHLAGIIARCDLAVGSHKPPANEVVAGALGLTRRVDDVDHGRANANGVNAIKAVPGRGIRVLGARTTSRRERQWRYLNVRRLVTQIQRSVAAYAGWLVFEPHDRALSEEVERVVRQLLDDVWRAGGLEGGTAEEAYSVRVEDPEAGTSVGEGALVVEIGLQPPYPAEHVVVRIDVPDPGVSRPAGGGGEGGRDR